MSRAHGQGAPHDGSKHSRTVYQNQVQHAIQQQRTHDHQSGAPQHHYGTHPYHQLQQGMHQRNWHRAQHGRQQPWQHQLAAGSSAAMPGQMSNHAPYFAAPALGTRAAGLPNATPADHPAGARLNVSAPANAVHQPPAINMAQPQIVQAQRHGQAVPVQQQQQQQRQPPTLSQEQEERPQKQRQQQQQQQQQQDKAPHHQQSKHKHLPVVYDLSTSDSDAGEATQQPAKRQRLEPAVATTSVQVTTQKAPMTAEAAAAAASAAADAAWRQAAADAALRQAAAARVLAAGAPPPVLPTPAAPVLNPRTQQFYADLAAEIKAFAAAVAPTPAEVGRRRAAFGALQNVVARSLPAYSGAVHVKTELFGSEAAGMATHESDLDVVVTGLAAQETNGLFDQDVKQQVVQMLRRLERDMRSDSRLQVYHSFVISGARMPIVKSELYDGLHLDVSIGNDSGPRAAAYTQQKMRELPALRPLVLLLKSMLKQLDLADVSKGGLGGWSLINMVIAHLKECGRQGHDNTHTGFMLHTFLAYYGFSFSYEGMSVAPARGLCFLPKGQLVMSEAGMKLCIADPITGRNISGGSHRIADVRAAFQAATRALSSAMAQHQPAAGRAPGAAAAGRGALALQQWWLLDLIVDAEWAASRNAGGDGDYEEQGYGGDGGWQGQQAGHKRHRDD